jgi:2-amino-4-hydroxy-6-hydroxymethyldihydropteridine diphosphokinase
MICYLGLGSNVGNTQNNLDTAIHHIKCIDGIKYIRKAKYYKTKAWGKTNQNNFLNTVIEIITNLSSDVLLEKLQKVENQMGRVRKEKWGERNIDIDILTYGQESIQQKKLVIPHQYLTQRSFVLAPLFELNPDLQLAGKGKISEFIDNEILKKEILEVF